jgi:hypothetical protein
MVKVPEGYKGKTYIGGRYVYEHRLIMEQKLGRLLAYNEVIHHIDGNKMNNDPNNLKLETRSEHSPHHAPEPPKITLICDWCKGAFERPKRNVKKNKRTFCCLSHSVSFQQKERWKKK